MNSQRWQQTCALVAFHGERIGPHRSAYPSDLAGLPEPKERRSWRILLVREQLVRARQVQMRRSVSCNSLLTSEQLQLAAAFDPACELLMVKAAYQLWLSLRNCHRMQRVARTIADLAGSEAIQAEHLVETLGFCQLN